MGDYFVGEEMIWWPDASGSAPDARAVFLIRRFPPGRRAYFLLGGQKKVAKEKATPGSAPGKPGPLRYSAGRAACLNSPAAQTRQADCSRPACVSQRLSRGPKNRWCAKGVPHFWPFWRVDHSKAFSFFAGCAATPFRVPMWRAEQRRRAGGCRRGLSEAWRSQAEFRSRPARRVAQGTRRSRAQNLGSPFLWLLSFGEAKESTPAGRRKAAAKPMRSE